MKRTFKTFILVVGIFSFTHALASEPTQMDNMMKNLLSHQRLQMEALLEMMEDPKMLKAYARYYKKFYDA